MTLAATLRAQIREPAAHAIVIQLVGAAAAFLVYLGIARAFGAVVSGEYALFVQTVIAAATVALFGYDQKVLRAIAHGLATDNPGQGWQQMRFFAMRLLVALLVVGVVLVVAEPWLVDASFNAGGLWLLPLAVAAYALLRFVTSAMRGASSVRMSQALVAAQPVLMMAAVIALIAGAQILPVSAYGLEALYAVSIAAPFVVAVFLLWRIVKGWRRAEPSQSAEAVAPDTHALGLAVLVPTIATWAGFAAIGYVVNTVEVAIYQACFLLTTPFNMIKTTYNSATSPEYAPLLARDDRAGLWALHRKHARVLLVIGAVPLVLMAVLAEPILHLFGPDFGGGALALQVFAIGMLANLGFGSVRMMMIMDGQDAAFFRITLGALVVWAAILMLTLPTLGVLGAAIGFTAQVLLTQIGALWVMKNRRPLGGSA